MKEILTPIVEKKLIFLSTKDTRIFLFLCTHIIESKHIRNYLLPSSITLKLCNKNIYNYITTESEKNLPRFHQNESSEGFRLKNGLNQNYILLIKRPLERIKLAYIYIYIYIYIYRERERECI